MEESPRFVVDLVFCLILTLLIAQVATSLEQKQTLLQNNVGVETVKIDR
jgi:hypothetical protein